jgi:transposase-like protein
VDGKYVAVKGYDRKIPVVYGIDYLTHDIPHYVLSVAENYPTCKSFFTSLRLQNYPLQAIVSDDNINIYQAGLSVYPKAVTQLCQNHYKEGIRQILNVRTDSTLRPFMDEIEFLFAKRRQAEEFNRMAGKIYYRFGSDDTCRTILLDIQRRLPQLLAYTQLSQVPRTTNLIESFNSHLEGRLKTIKGFESFKHADAWLNAYFIRRRLKKFTDCEKKFRYLNGKCSLELTLKPNYDFNDVLRLIR